jgi:uncharacterized protein
MDRDGKLNRLTDILQELGSVLVAFSGGADSAFLLKAAKGTLGDNVLAVTAVSDFFPDSELKQARSFACRVNARHLILRYPPPVRVRQNRPDRCYFCKRELFSRLQHIARERSIAYVIDGSNRDDKKDFRPGNKALRELKIRSPLQEAGFTKEDIRRLSRRMRLGTWNKPAFTCLATRIPYGEAITPGKIRIIREAEAFLRKLGFSRIRVRLHNSLARIEVAEEEIPALVRARRKISEKLRALGCTYSTVDLNGYCQGSLNRDSMVWKRKK